MTKTSNHYGFWAILGAVFLLPVFFIPGAILSVGNAKVMLAVLAVVLASTIYLYGAWREREVTVPNSRVLVFGLGLVLAYLLSALLAPVISLSLFGYNFEPGTFGSILLGFLALYLVIANFSESSKSVQLLLAIFGSLSILALFVVVRMLTGGEWFQFGQFGGVLGNPLGSFTDLGVIFGLFASLSALSVGILPMKRSFKIVLYSVFVLSTILLSVMGYQSAFIITILASVFIFLYFSKVESHFYFQSNAGHEKRGKFFSPGQVLPVVLGLVALAFLVNPTLPGGGSLGNSVSVISGVSNTDIRPTLSTTLSIAKSVFATQALLGAGPGNFDEAWNIYKPVEINATDFWAIIFPAGSGFLPTQIVTTGLLGSLAWLLFLGSIGALALKILSNIPESRAGRFVIISSLLTTLFLWVSFFIYSPSFAVFMLAFVSLGVLVSSAVSAGIISTESHRLSSTSHKYVGNSLIALLLVLVLFLGWSELKIVLGSYHHSQAVRLSSIEGVPVANISSALDKAVKFAPIDVYYRSMADLNFSVAKSFANSATGTPETNRAGFEQALSRSIAASRQAIAVNPSNAGNWVALGVIYSNLVPKPLAIEGAYESAQGAFSEAARRSPNDPSLALLLAQLELNNENTDNAKAYIRTALSIKGNYIDAYLLAAQIEYNAKNYQGVKDLLSQALAFDPENQSIKDAIEKMDVEISTPTPTLSDEPQS